jgi:hypothetical protein
VQTDTACNTVNEDGIRDRQRNEVREIEFEEICVAQDWLVGDTSNHDEDQKYPGDQIEEGAAKAMPDDGAMASAVLGRTSHASLLNRDFPGWRRSQDRRLR